MKPADINAPTGFKAGKDDGTYTNVLQIPSSNFAPTSLKTLEGIPTYSSFISALACGIPITRAVTKGAGGQHIIGHGRLLNNDELENKVIAVSPNGFPLDINSDAIQLMITKINIAVADANKRSSRLAQQAQIKQDLISQDIISINDAPGIIYQDKKGNKLIDFRHNIGDVGSRIALNADLVGITQSLKGLVKVPLSDNQFMALASLELHIGGTKFANSRVLEELNKGNYERVPVLFLNWRTGAMEQGGSAQVRQDYLQRRKFEAELFTTPDWAMPRFRAGITKSFAQLRHEIMVSKVEALDASKIEKFIDRS